MATGVRTEILAAIGKTDDVNMKLVLLLLLGVMEEIGGKIDAMRADEKGLREAVLNGHEPVHHSHHEWVAGKMQQEIDDAAEMKDSKRKIRDEMIIRVLWVIVAAVIGGIFLAKTITER